MLYKEEDLLAEEGIDFKTNIEVGKDITSDELKVVMIASQCYWSKFASFKRFM